MLEPWKINTGWSRYTVCINFSVLKICIIICFSCLFHFINNDSILTLSRVLQFKYFSAHILQEERKSVKVYSGNLNPWRYNTNKKSSRVEKNATMPSQFGYGTRQKKIKFYNNTVLCENHFHWRPVLLLKWDFNTGALLW